MQIAASARVRRDTGMTLAEEKANKDAPGWSEDALHGIELYCVAHPDRDFLAEEAQEWAEAFFLEFAL